MKMEQLALKMIIDELKKAEEKFPGFPEDVVHCAAILGEEAGESLKAALDLHYGREPCANKLMKETAQAGAMALRFLIRLLDPSYYPAQEEGGRYERNDFRQINTKRR